MPSELRMDHLGALRDDWVICAERRASDARGMEGVAILLGGSVAVLSVLGGVLMVIARLTGGPDDE